MECFISSALDFHHYYVRTGEGSQTQGKVYLVHEIMVSGSWYDKPYQEWLITAGMVVRRCQKFLRFQFCFLLSRNQCLDDFTENKMVDYQGLNFSNFVVALLQNIL